MADLKLSDLASAAGITDDTFFYTIQGGVSRKLSSNVFSANLIDPVLKNKVILDGVQLIRGTDTDQTISISKSRTEFVEILSRL